MNLFTKAKPVSFLPNLFPRKSPPKGQKVSDFKFNFTIYYQRCFYFNLSSCFIDYKAFILMEHGQPLAL